jgi:hypothetical protein
MDRKRSHFCVLQLAGSDRILKRKRDRLSEATSILLLEQPVLVGQSMAANRSDTVAALLTRHLRGS